MANKTRHVGVLRPTVPTPEVFWGTIDEVAAHIGITRRAAISILDGTTKSSRKGHRAMTEEEQKQYYQPPKPPKKLPKKTKKYQQKMYWRITFLKDWKKGQSYPKESGRIFTGTPQDFVKFVGCNIGQIYRMINWHLGLEEKYPLKSVKGWSICRIRKYEKPVAKFVKRERG